jgi:hypothetical protein
VTQAVPAKPEDQTVIMKKSVALCTEIVGFDLMVTVCISGSDAIAIAIQ